MPRFSESGVGSKSAFSPEEFDNVLLISSSESEVSVMSWSLFILLIELISEEDRLQS